MNNLKIKIDGRRATLSGSLDESSDLKPLVPLFDGKSDLTIDFKGVTRVNSCGVREWVGLVQRARVPRLTYEQCSMVVVKQLNAVPDFQGRATVSTFLAPYFCESCDAEQLVALETSKVEVGQPPERPCPTCKAPMSFDAIPAQYLSFVKRSRPGEAA